MGRVRQMKYRNWIMLSLFWVGLLIGTASAEEFTQKPEVLPSETPVAKAPTKKPKKSEPNWANEGPKPSWIWGPDENTAYTLTRDFETDATKAVLIASCDNEMDVLLNGKSIAKSNTWENPVMVSVEKQLKPGKNVLTAKVKNHGGVSGFVAKLVLLKPDSKPAFIITDKSWKIADDKDAKLNVMGKLGRQPWGNIFQKAGNQPVAALQNVFQTRPGFQVELLYTVPKNTQGSWVCLTTDDKGRLLASDQGGKGIYRITPAPIGGEDPTRVERLDLKMSSAQGMLHAFGSLYFSVNGGPGSGFYRAQDTNGDDQYDKVEKLKSFQGGGEHGPHAIRLSPDGKSLYVIAGNHTNPPEAFDSSRVPKNWGEDLLLPRQWDARGHARGKLAPGGWIAKTNPEGKTWELVSSGYRNPYDMDFNADGELFAYDADMEWDMGMPWYRPTRVVHAVSGSEFGWRSGTGKWPTYFEDSVPPLVNIGPGSPVGVTFGYGTKFPAKYQSALYLLDWTFGTIYAIHSQPDGASYSATKEEFLSRTPLPLTDAVVGKDGALYFTVGGRGTQSELYRVTYIGKESTETISGRDEKFAELRALRQRLETFHDARDASAADVDFLWSHLNHEDRFIRYAARVGLEHRPVETWRDRFADHAVETNPAAWTIIQAAVALARQGTPADQPAILQALGHLEFSNLTKPQKLGLLRAYSLAFIRQGKPSRQIASGLASRLASAYPADDRELNRELCRVLVYLESPIVIDQTLKLLQAKSEMDEEELSDLLTRNARYGGTIAKMIANQPDRQKLLYAFLLRNAKYGWTLEQRKAYLKWLETEREKSGGASFQGFIDNMRKDFLANASEAERFALKATIAETQPKPTSLPKPIGPGKDWTLEEVVALTKNGLSNRNFENGKRTFGAARCVLCHRFGGEGGATGPDLTNLAGRFSNKDLAESIILPSKVISDQYKASKVLTSSGEIIAGRIVNEADGKITIVTDAEDATKVEEIAESDIEAIMPSTVSLMPKDLLKTLNKQEVLDLLAYLQSRGNPNNPMFETPANSE